MRYRRSLLISVLLLLLTISAAVMAEKALACGPCTIVNETPSPPQWLNPGYRFIASVNTTFGEGLTIEVHDRNQGVGAGYARYACTIAPNQTSLPAGTTARYQCNSTTTIPDGPANPDVEYQYTVCDFGTTNNNCHNFTGFNWSFSLGPNLVTLQKISATATHPQPLPLTNISLLLTALVISAAFWKHSHP